MTYDDKSIQQAVTLLNSITVTGIENCKRVVIINEILQNPKEDSDGSGTRSTS